MEIDGLAFHKCRATGTMSRSSTIKGKHEIGVVDEKKDAGFRELINSVP